MTDRRFAFVGESIENELRTQRIDTRPELRENDGKNIVCGYASVFYRADNPGTQFRLATKIYERIMPGAFDKAIARDEVSGLFNHDESLVLGSNVAGTMSLSVDEHGLRYDIDLGDTTVARDVAVSIGRQDVRGSSFAFIVEAVNWRDEKEFEVREITDVRLFDVGPVTRPAYRATSTGLRDDGPKEDWQKEHDNWREHKRAVGMWEGNLLHARTRLSEIDHTV
mgnify:CR=1 FL=1